MPEAAPPPALTPDSRLRLKEALLFTPTLQRGVPMVVIADGTVQGATHFRVVEPVARILQLFDGTRTVQEVARDAAEIAGEPVSIQDLAPLIAQMWQYGFIEGTAALTGEGQWWRRFFAWRFVQVSTGDRFAAFARALAPVFSRRAFPFLLAVFVALFVVDAIVVWRALSGRDVIRGGTDWRFLLGYAATVLFLSVFHEFGHGVAYVNHGGKRPAIGLVLFMGAFLAMYTDVTEAYRFQERWRRVSVSLAGPLVNLVAMVPLVLLWQASGGWLEEVLYMLVLVNAIMASFALFPGFRSDLYYVLVDVFETPNLQEKSWRYVLGYLREAFGGAPPALRPDSRMQAALFAGWGVASLSVLVLAWGFLVGRFLAPPVASAVAYALGGGGGAELAQGFVAVDGSALAAACEAACAGDPAGAALAAATSP